MSDKVQSIRWTTTNTELISAIASTMVEVTWKSRVKAKCSQNIWGVITLIALAKCCYKGWIKRVGEHTSYTVHDTCHSCCGHPSWWPNTTGNVVSCFFCNLLELSCKMSDVILTSTFWSLNLRTQHSCRINTRPLGPYWVPHPNSLHISPPEKNDMYQECWTFCAGIALINCWA